MAPYLVEEAHEVQQAIEADAFGDEVRGELGDVLLNVFMIARMADERGAFGIDDVAEHVVEKMVRRHPHVFGDDDGAASTRERPDRESPGVESSDATRRVRERWEELKRAESAGSARPRSRVLGPLPPGLPALSRAHRIGTDAAKVGFDWPDPGGALEKLHEEVVELERAIADELPAADRRAAIEHELGDVLQAAVSVARHHGIDAESALRRSLDRFEARFLEVEAEIDDLESADLPTLEAAWQRAKRRAE